MPHSSDIATPDLRRTEEGECRSRGAKVKQSEGEMRRLEGVWDGQCCVGGEERKVMGCRSCGVVVVCARV